MKRNKRPLMLDAEDHKLLKIKAAKAGVSMKVYLKTILKKTQKLGEEVQDDGYNW